MRVIPTALLTVLASALASAAPQTAAAADRVATSIYKCELGGVTTFSDRPCGLDAKVHTPDPATLNTYEAPPTAAPARQESASNRSARKSAPAREDRSEAKRADLCARNAQTLKEIRSKMRSGYTAKEGEKLRARADKLRQSQRAGRCS
jgi:hypothetical protein